MAETSHEIRHELALTRDRVGTTIAALERKVNPKHVLNEHPLAAVGIAFGTGVLLATTGAGMRAAAQVRTQARARAEMANASAGNALDKLLDTVLSAATAAITTKVSDLVDSATRSRGPREDKARAA